MKNVSHGNTFGKSQIYFKVNEIPKSITCQVQPREGLEVYTVFSIFCSSGKQDLYYEYSYQTSTSSKKTLYKGFDIQYYFHLPAGEPSDGYRVTIFSQITNPLGSKTHLCPVTVTVLPSFMRNKSITDLPELELFSSGTRNLSALLFIGNHIEIRNYVILLTNILNRLYTEEIKMAFELQSKIRNVLIFTVCSLPFQDQEEIVDIVSLLLDLLRISKQVTANSAVVIINSAKAIFDEYFEPGQILLQRELVEYVVLLITQALEVSFKHSETQNSILDGLEIISNFMLVRLL
ncbi:polycystin-1-like protein 1 [Pelobates fuscus]|uniref:polycystin-1-like protein 1 n=1 Tax=Pelobates fuscus TaxID=191477 RepID=UPI002FE465D1